jgi:hypothetical protein
MQFKQLRALEVAKRKPIHQKISGHPAKYPTGPGFVQKTAAI